MVGEVGLGIVRLRDYKELAIISVLRIHGSRENLALIRSLYHNKLPF
jgi:hypothetical protein